MVGEAQWVCRAKHGCHGPIGLFNQAAQCCSLMLSLTEECTATLAKETSWGLLPCWAVHTMLCHMPSTNIEQHTQQYCQWAANHPSRGVCWTHHCKPMRQCCQPPVWCCQRGKVCTLSPYCYPDRSIQQGTRARPGWPVGWS